MTDQQTSVVDRTDATVASKPSGYLHGHRPGSASASADCNESVASLCSVSSASSISADDTAVPVTSRDHDSISTLSSSRTEIDEKEVTDDDDVDDVSLESGIPTRFICPLTLEIMKNPVFSKHGHNFERNAIIRWIAKEEVCPLTRKPLGFSSIIRNHRLEQEIAEWKEEQRRNRNGNRTTAAAAADDDDDAEDLLRSEAPEEFICPLSMTVMRRPVMTRYGDSMERAAIVRWLYAGNGFCPIRGKPLQPRDILPNRALQQRIRAWKIANDIATDSDVEGDGDDTGDESDNGKYTPRYGLLEGRSDGPALSAAAADRVGESRTSSSRQQQQQRRRRTRHRRAAATATASNTAAVPVSVTAQSQAPAPAKRSLRSRFFGKR